MAMLNNQKVSQETMFFWNLAPGDTGFLQATEINHEPRGYRGSNSPSSLLSQTTTRPVGGFPVELYMYTHRYYTQYIYTYIHIYIYIYIYILYILYIYYFQHFKFLHRDFAKAPTVELTPPIVVSDSPPKNVVLGDLCHPWVTLR